MRLHDTNFCALHKDNGSETPGTAPAGTAIDGDTKPVHQVDAFRSAASKPLTSKVDDRLRVLRMPPRWSEKALAGCTVVRAHSGSLSPTIKEQSAVIG